MIRTLELVAGALSVLALLTMLVLVTRRLALARAERRREAQERALRPLALALVDGEAPDVDAAQERALASILARYASKLRGDGRAEITRFFEERGGLDRELRRLRARRGSHRAAAAFALGRLGARAAAADLRDALGDPAPFVRTAAAHALGRIGDRDAFDALALVAQVDEYDPAQAAAQALATIDPRRARDLAATADASAHLHEAARVQFVPDPVCWTEAPETLRVLSRQRRPWQRGLAETLWRHRRLTLNPRYGPLGLVAMPYFVVFELLGPPLALLGYLVLPIAWALGLLSFGFLLSFLLVALLLGQLLSISALALEEFSFRRHPRGREIGRMLWYAAVENLGYRQLTDVWRGQAFWDLMRRKRSWGEMTRRGFQTAPRDQAG